MEEVRSRAAGALTSAIELLRETPIDPELHSHGWTPKFVDGLADECERLRDMVEAGTYPSQWGGAGLSRWMQEQVDPTAMGSLKQAVQLAQSYLQSHVRQGHALECRGSPAAGYGPPQSRLRYPVGVRDQRPNSFRVCSFSFLA